ncbi:hypothetical protein GA0070607_4920 [Micromonospora coriariae]|uniref:Uncharacterized protein n=1 Tax=Micromonospora coriariae TaxID=285665 RepID=A0A1C4XA36_9ACTN|nr:hypothetical protein [Micromonospora coriariae]SCF05292.1 hypothetical protein GA0070607_4920 [Micromonospora coriariae]
MNPQDAQFSLDDIRRLQDRTQEQIVRQPFARSSVPLAALGLFAGLASVDLQNPWRTAAVLLGFGLFAGVGIVHEHRALVQRKPTGLEWLFWVGLSAGLMLLFGVFRIVAWAWLALPSQGLLSQGTLAAAATAATYVVITPLVRRIFRAIVLRAGRA